MKRPARTESPLWRRWTGALLLLSAVAVPLMFDLQGFDTFARAKLAVLRLLVPLAAVGPVVAILAGRLRPVARPRGADIALVLFLALAALATMASPAVEHSLQGERFQYQGLLTLLLYAVAYAVARVALVDSGSLLRIFGALSVATAVVAAYGLVQQVRLDPFFDVLNKGRIFSTIGQANNLAAFLVLALPCVGALAATHRWRAVRIVLVVVLLGGLAALGLTLSRGGYLGILAALLAMAAVLVPSTGIAWGRVRVAAIVTAVAIVLLLALPPTREQITRVAQRVVTTIDLDSGSVRSHLDLWAVAVRMTGDHPLLGTGPDSYVLEFPPYRDKVLAPDRAEALKRFRPESPHNVYLAISSDLGIPALATYVALAGFALARVVRSIRASSGPQRAVGLALLGALVGHLVTDTFITAELTGSWLYWTFLGAAVSLPVGAAATTQVVARNREGSGKTRTPR